MKKLSYSFILLSTLGIAFSTSKEANADNYPPSNQSRDQQKPNRGKKGQIHNQARQYDNRTDVYTVNRPDVDQLTPDNPGETILQRYAKHIGREENYYEDNETNTLLAKINTAAQLGGKVELIPIRIKGDTNTQQQQLTEAIKGKNATIVYIKMNRSSVHRPYHINQITYRAPDGNTNKCNPSYLYDTRTYEALSKETLGEGQGWQDNRTLPNWKTMWKHLQLLIVVEYGKQTFIVAPKKVQPNDQIQNITPDQWHTSLKKKILIGTGVAGTAAAAAAAYYAR
jgi:hypothetical protein